MSPARNSQARSNPHQPSIFAAENLPPAYPQRAAWGTTRPLRAWQAAALERYLRDLPQDFLAVATPGAGKTTFALRIAAELLSTGEVHKVTIVCPTEHLKFQWAEAAARVGIQVDPSYTNSQGALGSRYDGVALTYAQVAANANLHRARTSATRTLVILDEIHHGGDALSWGDAIREAFTPARKRLALTGTPFRSDTSPIPFVTYAEDASGNKRSKADYAYGYAEALRDGVVRPVMFMTYSGEMHWRTKAGDELAARLGEPLTKDLEAQAWRTALAPDGDWIPAVLAAADQRLTEVRRQVPDAGGLVIASDQATARAYAAKLKAITGQPPTVVLSDDSGASSRIESFSASQDRWMVAVRMVSEGVDVPRLAVGVYATSTSTPLFFAQAVGRFVRSRARGETASVFLPSVTPLLALAGELEVQRDHVLNAPKQNDGAFAYPEDRLIAEANQTEQASDDLFGAFEAMNSTAEFDRVLFDGGEFGTGAMVGSVEEQEYLGLPGLLSPEEVTALLRQRQDAQIKASKREAAAAAQRRANSGMDDARRRVAARKELSQLVSAWARRSGQPHGVVHNELRRVCGGPEVAQASTEEIEKRVRTLRRWFVGKR
ncbi:DNA phosphorothioation system restriction enzyme [Actinomyces bovis]|uniref:DNA phosphorothioation system restriction enzyme n=1 Tax=Actinomyces bovis TaxID=1658 RepID=A0ABY1VR04_9ACTO|nr:DEAD/DEAH box helicase [Actinomyces bovis]SPT53847.1 DNA phosphorothioation system restriction enzyme [Actinomyces bovis]VEG53238.1 DNA phosphorothioation system restriction enzyme [Actinomyces israelii]